MATFLSAGAGPAAPAGRSPFFAALPLPACRIGLVVFCLLAWLPGFFSLPPGDRDESRFAQATKQMIQTGDYVRIMNGTEPRNRKPIGIYWLQAPFALAAGPDLANPIWPYRVPSLLGGLAAVLATFEIALLMTGDRRTGLLAGGMLGACVILATETHIAKTDAALLGATTIAMAVLARAWLAADVRRWQAALFWFAAGAGILLKGPITPMVLGLTVVTLCIWERRMRWLAALRPAWGVPLMLLVVMPWFVAIGFATHGAFFTQAIGGDLGRKLGGGSESHGGFPGEHLLLLPLLAFPLSFAVLQGLPSAWATRRQHTTRFLLAWLIPAWLVFEAVPTKLPHYTLPLYPALFLIAALSLVGGTEQALPRSTRLVFHAALIAAATLLAAAALALPWVLHGAWWLGIPAALAAGLAAWCAWHGRIGWAIAAAIPLNAAILLVELPNLSALWIAPRVEAALRQNWPGWNKAGDHLAVAGYAEPSLMFLAGTDLLMLPNGAHAADALASGDITLALVGDRDLSRFEGAAAVAGLTPHKRGEVRGFNYSRGRWVTLSLMTK